jgi:hypothetical protein
VAHHHYPHAMLDLAHQRIAHVGDRPRRCIRSVLGEQCGHFGACLDSLSENPQERDARKDGLDGARSLRSRAPELFLRLSGGRHSLCVVCVGQHYYVRFCVLDV